MAMKCCTKLETARERCHFVFQGHPSNFKVTRYKTSPILNQIGRFRTIGRSQLSNPSDLPCFIFFNNGLDSFSIQILEVSTRGKLLKQVTLKYITDKLTSVAMPDIYNTSRHRPQQLQGMCYTFFLSIGIHWSTSGLGLIHFFQFNSIPIQVGFRIFQFNSIPIQIRFRIFQFNSNSIHFLSIPIQFNSNFMHRDKQMNKITGWNKFYWIVP